jgi:CRISPR system Cascade subunit CasA
MTIWRNSEKNKNAPPVFAPCRHDPAKQLWRNFSSLTVETDAAHRPGVVSWILRLRDLGFLERNNFRFVTAAVKYGDKDFFVDDVFADSLTFNAGILKTLDDGQEGWTDRIISELGGTEKWVKVVGELAARVVNASGGDGAGARVYAREQAYFRLDEPFRRWLVSIEPERDDMDEKSLEWRKIAQSIIRKLGDELYRGAGKQAFAGRNGISAPKAYNYFLGATSITSIKQRGDKDEQEQV